MAMLSAVVPCYNEEQALPHFYEAICAVRSRLKELHSLDMEIVFVDDGSRDRTLALLRDYSKRDPGVRYVSFSRNFGKEAGMYAGLSAARGDYVAILDADMQDPPDMLPQMFDILLEKGCDCVATFRTSRKGEPPVRSFFARMFYRFINKISRTKIVDGARDFRLMTRQMTDAILSVTEYNRFSKGIFSWVGFETEWIPYENTRRVAGKTKWSFWSLFLYSLDGMLAYSTAPLAIASLIGLLFCAIAFIMIVLIIVRTLIWGDPVSGWPSLVCIILMVSGIQLFCIGILGQYISKSYLEAKKRPLYIIKEQSEDPPRG